MESKKYEPSPQVLAIESRHIGKDARVAHRQAHLAMSLDLIRLYLPTLTGDDRRRACRTQIALLTGGVW